MNKIIIKIIAILITVVVSFYLGFYVHFYLADFILDLHVWSTGNKIKFVGKGILIPNTQYFFFFIISTTLLFYQFLFSNINWIKLFFAWIFTLGFSIIIISVINANLLVMNCTACDNEILKIRFHNASYDTILNISIVLSIIPSILSFIKINKKVKS